ncbi:hypothetical protein [Pelosinus propionicus]|uniref:hypothetical protein n=1 Tax=Pelosinus propionicus TaxID=380084 RepID=UPI0015872C46|nr:hypothetical protein [Pelosinus propionicus]
MPWRKKFGVANLTGKIFSPTRRAWALIGGYDETVKCYKGYFSRFLAEITLD